MKYIILFNEPRTQLASVPARVSESVLLTASAYHLLQPPSYNNVTGEICYGSYNNYQQIQPHLSA